MFSNKASRKMTVNSGSSNTPSACCGVVYLKEKKVFGFAGLWEEWLDKETGEVTQTCTIITTEANDVLKPVHDRMPVILKSNSSEE